MKRTKLSEEEKLAHDGKCIDTPAVYCGTYRKYNDGDLYGMWVDISTFNSGEEVIEFCKRLHYDESDPELMFQDFEDFPRKFYSECMSSKTFDKIIEWYNLDEDERDYVQEYWEEHDESVSIEDIKDRHLYSGDTNMFFYDMIDSDLDTFQIPPYLRNAINYEDAKNELSDGYVVTSNNVFTNNELWKKF